MGIQQASLNSVLFFPGFFAIPLSRQRFLHATAFAWFQVERMTLHFFDNVFLLNLALKPPQGVLKRLAFLQTNLCQKMTPRIPSQLGDTRLRYLR